MCGPRTCPRLATCGHSRDLLQHPVITFSTWVNGELGKQKLCPKNMINRPSKAIPIVAHNTTSAQHMVFCARSLWHLLSKKPLGSFVKSPWEQRDAILKERPLFVCGNSRHYKKDEHEAFTYYNTSKYGPNAQGFPTICQETGTKCRIHVHLLDHHFL